MIHQGLKAGDPIALAILFCSGLLQRVRAGLCWRHHTLALRFGLLGVFLCEREGDSLPFCKSFSEKKKRIENTVRKGVERNRWHLERTHHGTRHLPNSDRIYRRSNDRVSAES